MAEPGGVAMKVQARLSDRSGQPPITIELTGYPSNTFESMSRYPLRCLVDGKDATAQYSGEVELVSLFVKGGPAFTVSTYDYEKAVASPYIPDVVDASTEQTMPDALAISTLLYLGKLQLLLRQWERFHDLTQQLPPPGREGFTIVFEEMLAAMVMFAAPGPAIQVWQMTESALRQWIERYKLSSRQNTHSIGDFQPDRQRIDEAIDQLIRSLFSDSGDSSTGTALTS